MVEAYAKSKETNIDGEEFCFFYESKNWMVGKNKMTNWKSSAMGWAKRDEKKTNGEPSPSQNYRKMSQ